MPFTFSCSWFVWCCHRREEEGEERMDLSGTQGELPIPMHATSPYVGLHHDHHGHHPNNGRSPSPPPAVAQHAHSFPSPVVAAGVAAEESKKRVVGGIAVGGGAKFRECLKNHAASIGGNATDGCGEFMPNGEEGTIEALKCSACGCHRNFHRKELDHPEAAPCDYTGRFRGRRHLVGYPPHAADPFAYPPRALALPLPLPPPPPHHMVMPLSAMQTSESDEMDGVGGSGSRPPTMAAKKRFRTKFTAEQKEKMLDFAEQVGWRLQRLDDGMVQQFCQEVGVKRRVLKVWMHNNKHNLAKKPPPPPSPPQPGEPIGSPSPPPLRLE